MREPLNLSELGRPTAGVVAPEHLRHDDLHGEGRDRAGAGQGIPHDLFHRQATVLGADVFTRDDPRRLVDLVQEAEEVRVDRILTLLKAIDPGEPLGLGARQAEIEITPDARHVARLRSGDGGRHHVRPHPLETVEDVRDPVDLKGRDHILSLTPTADGRGVVGVLLEGFQIPVVLVGAIVVQVIAEAGVEAERPDDIERGQVGEEAAAEVGVGGVTAEPVDEILGVEVRRDVGLDRGAEDGVDDVEVDGGLAQVFDLDDDMAGEGGGDEVHRDGEVELDDDAVVQVGQHAGDGGESRRHENRPGDEGAATAVQQELERENEHGGS